MPRSMQRPALKILSDSLGKFSHENGTVLYNGREVHNVEVAGACIDMNKRFMNVLDFCGEVPMTHSEQYVELGLPHVFLCRLYIKNGTLRLHCKAARKVDIFEEIFFWAEAVNLRKTLDFDPTDSYATRLAC